MVWIIASLLGEFIISELAKALVPNPVSLTWIILWNPTISPIGIPVAAVLKVKKSLQIIDKYSGIKLLVINKNTKKNPAYKKINKETREPNTLIKSL